MQPGRGDPEKRKILEIDKSFRRWVGVEIAPAQDRRLPCRLLRPARQHDPRALERIAGGALVQHQRDPVIAEDIFRMHGKPRDQQDRGSVGMAGDIDEGTIGIAAFGHQGGQRALPAPPQQRTGEFRRVKISGGLHRLISGHLIAKRAFSRPDRGAIWGTAYPQERFAELGHTSAQLALLVDRVQSPFMRRIAGLPAVWPLSYSKAGSCPQSPWSMTTATFLLPSRSRSKPKAIAS